MINSTNKEIQLHELREEAAARLKVDYVYIVDPIICLTGPNLTMLHSPEATVLSISGYNHEQLVLLLTTLSPSELAQRLIEQDQ